MSLILFSEAAIAVSAYTLGFCGASLGAKCGNLSLAEVNQPRPSYDLRTKLFLPSMFFVAGTGIGAIKVQDGTGFFEIESPWVGAAFGGLMGVTFGACVFLGMVAAERHAYSTNKMRSHLAFRST